MEVVEQQRRERLEENRRKAQKVREDKAKSVEKKMRNEKLYLGRI